MKLNKNWICKDCYKKFTKEEKTLDDYEINKTEIYYNSHYKKLLLFFGF